MFMVAPSSNGTVSPAAAPRKLARLLPFPCIVRPPIWRPMHPIDLLTSTPNGLFSPLGGIFVDPMRPVERALITHGHSDHARAGHGAVMATRETLEIMAVRCGEGFAGSTQAAVPGERCEINGVGITFVPAGHVLGSAQIVVEAQGTRIVVSGDYKRARDPTCAPSRSCPATSSSPKRPRAPRLPPSRCRGRGPQAPREPAAFSRARSSPRRLRARQGAARHRALA